MTILIVIKIWYKMECHRDKVVVRVTSIYDYLIGHGDTSVLLEGDSRLGYHVRHIITSIKATPGISCYNECKICQSVFCIVGLPVHTHPVGKRHSHNRWDEFSELVSLLLV